MKIIVAHSDRQYCNQLLLALAQRQWLVAFFTIFSSNKLGILRKFLPRRFQSALRKRAVDDALTPYVRHFPWIMAIDRLANKGLYWSVRNSYRWFDRRVAQQLARVDFDLIITYENANRHTLKKAREMGKTTVLDLAQIHHADIIRYGRWFMPPEQLELEENFINPMKAAALASTDYVLTLSTFAAESMRQNGWPAERLFTAHLGIDPGLFTLKKKYAASGPLRLVFVGTLTLRKGLSILFEAVNQLPPDTCTLTLIGPMADARDLLRRQAGRFVYLPFLHHEALAEHLRHADLFVFPSLLDSWAQTVLEAMACGTPAIVTENTGAKDAVLQGGGWVIPPNDASALCECLLHCLENRAEIETKGRQAHRIAQQYTWAHYHRRIAGIMQEIARREQIRLS